MNQRSKPNGESDSVEQAAADRAELRAEQVRLLYRQAPLSMLATVLNSLVLSAVLWNTVSRWILVAWLATSLLVVWGRDPAPRDRVITRFPTPVGIRSRSRLGRQSVAS